MDDTQTQSQTQSQLADLREQCEQLRSLVSSLLLLLLLVSLTLTIFLARQWRFSKSQIDLMSSQAGPIITEFNKNLPAMQDFIRKLNEYAKTHADFGPIVTRYHLNEVLSKPGTSPATATSTNK
jgi:hypothetical protein